MPHSGFDEWFDQRTRMYYRDNDDPNTGRERHVRKIRAKIIEIIRANNDNGIAHLQLAHIIKIDRKNLAHHMKWLMSKGLVKRGVGKQGKYYLVDKNHRGTIMEADFLGKGAAGQILENEDFPVNSLFSKILLPRIPSKLPCFSFLTK